MDLHILNKGIQPLNSEEKVMLNILLGSQVGILSIVTIVGSIIAVGGWTLFMFSKHKDNGNNK